MLVHGWVVIIIIICLFAWNDPLQAGPFQILVEKNPYTKMPFNRDVSRSIAIDNSEWLWKTIALTLLLFLPTGQDKQESGTRSPIKPSGNNCVVTHGLLLLLFAKYATDVVLLAMVLCELIPRLDNLHFL